MPKSAVIEAVENAIHLIRGQRVMLDSDLAEFYGVETKVLNQAVRRNIHRFPKDFAFQLEADEFNALRSQIVTSSGSHGGRRYLPWVFTEHGAVMLASVLNSSVAIAASVEIVRAFVKMRSALAGSDLVGKLVEIEQRLGGHDSDLATVFQALESLLNTSGKPAKEMGFHTLMEDEKGCPDLMNLPRKKVTYTVPKRTRKEKKA